MEPTKPLDGIKICAARIRNFRSLKAIDLEFGRLTVIIGSNNSGKTSFLEALNSAIGASRRNIGRHDIFLELGENTAPLDREILIDILIRPVDEKFEVVENFPKGSPWLSLWGRGIAQDESDRDFVAIRTRMSWDREKGDYTVERLYLREWLANPDDKSLFDTRLEQDVKASTYAIEPLSFHYMDAKRDIEEDFRHHGSFWHRLISELGMSDAHIKEIENQLADVNKFLVEKSETLKHTRRHLRELKSLVSCNAEGVEITPVAQKVRDLAKGIDVGFTTSGAQSFPLVRHGMGTRSLASILVFRAYMEWRTQRSSKNAIHPFLGLEEPESHLHPQAQRSLFRLISDIPGQVIVSTHSPFLVSQSEIGSIRHFRKEGPSSLSTRIDISGLSIEEISALQRKVIENRGEMFFARAIVFIEGESEEQALPVFAEEFWKGNVVSSGISFVSVGGNNYLPFVRSADACGIPWYVFSDGEPEPVSRLTKAVLKVGIKDVHKTQNIFILPNGHKWEEYLVEQKYQKEIEAVLNSWNEDPAFIASYIKELDGTPKKKNALRDYHSSGGRDRAIVDALCGNKAGYARSVAQQITASKDSQRRVPAAVRRLFEKISGSLQDLAEETSVLNAK
jgi:putative ATP-dependent endonuclease of OLD family